MSTIVDDRIVTGSPTTTAAATAVSKGAFTTKFARRLALRRERRLCYRW
jgi:hypothetical protein